MEKLTRKEAVELTRSLADKACPLAFDENDILKIVEIEKRQGVYVEVYVGKLWASLVRREGPGVSVLTFERIGDAWRAGAGSTIDASGPGAAELAAALATLEAQRSHFRPKPVPPAKHARPKTGPRLSEAEGAGSLAATTVTGTGTPRRSTDAEVDAAEAALGARFPAGYRTFVVALGRGVYGTNVRVYTPERTTSDLATWRARIEQRWFWGDTPLEQAHALDCICFADTLGGDELVFHPSDPDTILLLPRESEESRELGRGLAAALAKLVDVKVAELEAY